MRSPGGHRAGLFTCRVRQLFLRSSYELGTADRHVRSHDFPVSIPVPSLLFPTEVQVLRAFPGLLHLGRPPFTGIYRRAKTPTVESWGLVPAIHAFDSIANNVRTPRDLGSARGPQNPLPLCGGLWNVSAYRCAMPTGTIARPAAGVCRRVSPRQSCHHGIGRKTVNPKASKLYVIGSGEGAATIACSFLPNTFSGSAAPWISTARR